MHYMNWEFARVFVIVGLTVLSVTSIVVAAKAYARARQLEDLAAELASFLSGSQDGRTALAAYLRGPGAAARPGGYANLRQAGERADPLDDRGTHV